MHIKEAQDFLTIDGMRLLELEALASIYSEAEIEQLLQHIIKQKDDAIKEQLSTDKTSSKLDSLASLRYRYELALRSLRKEA